MIQFNAANVKVLLYCIEAGILYLQFLICLLCIECFAKKELTLDRRPRMIRKEDLFLGLKR